METIGLQKPAKKSLIKSFLGRVKINRFVLLAYLIMPALVIVVGFSAWTISGNSVNGTDGLFIASDVVNSYDYIQLKKAPNSQSAKFNLFETGFYDVEKNEFTTTPSIGIDYEIYLRNCFGDLLNDQTGAIYGIFTLKFPSGAQNPPDIFTGMTCKINDTQISEGTEISLNDRVLSITVEKISNTSTEYTALLRFNFTEGTTYPESASLNMAYTLSPDSIDYKALYDYLAVDTQNKLMVDVTITKNKPVTL